MKRLNISNRLKTIGDLVLDNSFVLDVGCDHGLLGIYLTLKKNCRVICSDINKKPLLSALNNIKKYELEDKIKLVLSDGIKNISEEADVLIISGMGASTIIKIIQNDYEKVRKYKKIIIQSNNDLKLIREYFTNNYFKIVDEKIVFEKNKYYTIIVFENCSYLYTLDENELYFGEYKYRNNNNFIEYKKYLLDRYMNILKNKDIEEINKLIGYLDVERSDLNE